MIGSTLRQARERAGLSPKQISASTKIRLPRILALECDDFDNLPNGFYLDAMVRAYAREVHIDPEPLIEWLRCSEVGAIGATGAMGLSAIAPSGAKADALEPVSPKQTAQRAAKADATEPVSPKQLAKAHAMGVSRSGLIHAAVGFVAGLAAFGAGSFLFDQAYAAYRDATAKAATEPVTIVSTAVAMPAPELTIPVLTPVRLKPMSDELIRAYRVSGPAESSTPINPTLSGFADGPAPTMLETVGHIDALAPLMMQPAEDALATETLAR